MFAVRACLATFATKFFPLKKALKILFIFFLSIIGLVVLISVLVNVTPVQNFLVRRVSHTLSKQLHTKVEVQHVNFRLFNRFIIDGAYVADLKGDTLLYAKELAINVTNFFFFRDRTVLYYVGLDGATVNLVRAPHDSTWNFQFIVDAFAKPERQGKGELPNVDIRKIDLKNIRVNQIDGWKGKNMHISADHISIRAKNIDPRKHKVLINSIQLDHPLFVLEKYQWTDTTSPPLPATDLAQNKGTDSLQWNTGNWQIRIGKIRLDKGAFALNDKEVKEIDPDFDPKHIAFYDINGTLDNAHFDKDSVICRLDITAKERSGLQVKKLEGRFKMSPVTIEVSDLDLETNKSHLKDFFALQFDEFDDLSDFVTKVTMRGHFTDAYVSSDDIGFFAPPLKKWDKDFRLNGLAYGTLDQLRGEDLNIRTGKSSAFEGSFSMTGLPDIQNTFIDLKATTLSTTGKDLQKFIPALQQAQGMDLDSLTYLNFEGNFVGFIYDFVAYGNFTSNLGNIRSDINLKFGPAHPVPVYTGSLSSKGFDLGTFLHLEQVGQVAFNTRIKGSGFTLAEGNAEVMGNIDKLEFKHYPYRNIQLEGTFRKKLFQGQVQIADTNLALNFRGSIDFNDSIPQFDFNSEVRRSDLHALNLTKDSITFSGKLEMNFEGNNINDFLGEARLYDIHLFKNKARVAFDTLVVNSYKDSENSKWLTLRGNEVSGYIHGNYDLKHLPDVMMLFLSRYFPNKIRSPEIQNINEHFSFALRLGNLDSALHSFIPELTSLNEGQLTGRINTIKDSLILNLDLGHSGYKNFRFNDIRLQSVGSLNRLQNTIAIGELYHRDSLLLPGTRIETVTYKDTSLITLRTSGTKALNQANIKTRFITLKDGYNIKILNSAINVNGKDWHITPDNEFLLKKNNIAVHHFTISHNNQRITITSADTSDKKNTFLVNLNNLYVGDFSRFFLPEVSLEGIANSTIYVADPLGDLKMDAALTVSQLWVNSDSVGLVKATASFDKASGSIGWQLDKTDDPENGFTTAGTIGVGEENHELQGIFRLDHTDIHLLHSFIAGYVSDLHGKATGEVQLKGTREAPELLGNIELDSVDIEVNYTKTRYSFNKETVKFSPGKIDLGSITLKDQEGRTAILSGDITHHHFDDLFFNISLNTQALQFLHTTKEDNPVYYGDAVASGKIDFTGPLSDMQMVINATPVKNTHIVLPLTDEEDIGKHDFIIFKQYGKELKTVRSKHKKVNLSVKLNANMNPNAQIDVIVDPASGDHITARGNGALQINVDLQGDFQMFGNYSITEGSYIFSFKGLLSREFAINQGSTISWNGDPANANINITAIYHVPGGANLSNLVAGETSALAGLDEKDRKLLQQREKIDVYLILKNSLMHPDITYDIRIPEASISASSLVMTRLQQIRQNPNLLINQVAALLAAGQFIPLNTGNTSSELLRASGLSSAGQWVSSQLNGVLNNLLGDQLSNLGLSFSMNYNAYSTAGNYGDIQRNDVQFNVSKNLFNNRVQVEVGPSVNWGRSNTPQAYNTSYFAGDFRFEYLITPDGRVRFIAFSRSNYDVLLNQNLTRSGIGISYSRRFDRLHELFLSKKEKEREEAIRKKQIQQYFEENQEDTLPAPLAPMDTTHLQRQIPAKKEE